MRAAAVLALLAGCYRPNPASSCRVHCEALHDDCPDGLTCEDGVCVVHGDICDPDGGVIASPDSLGPGDDAGGFPPCTGIGSTQTPLVTGTSYTTDGTLAIYEESVGHLNETTVNTPNAGSSIGFEAFNVSRPRMAPDRRELFMLEENGGNYSLRKATRGASKWTIGESVQVETVAVTMDFVPGTPSATNPRHMIVQVTAGQWREGIEDGLGAWSFPTLVKPVGVVNFQDPSLSPDGLRLVYVANLMGGPTQVFVSTREDITKPFLLSNPLYDVTAAGGSEQTPAMSPDCQSLYVNAGSVVLRVH